MAEAANPEGNSLYRLGGTCAATIAVAYLITIPLYAAVGAPPTGDGETWLNYLAGKTTGWWVILGLSVLTDLLFVPVAFSLYFALRRVNRTALLVATALVFLFVALDLAVTWANYGALIVLANHYASAATPAKRLADAAAANYPAAILSSRLEAVYAIVILSIGILITGLVMLRSVFNRPTAYVAVAIGVLGIATLTGSGLAVILNAVATIIWLFLVSYRLYRFAD